MKPIALAVALLLAACAGRDGGYYTVTGQYLGNPEQKIVEPEDGTLVLPEELMPAVEIKRASYSDRVIETTEVGQGELFLSTTHSGGFTDRVSDLAFRAMFQDEGEAPLEPERWLQITYAEFTVKGWSCLYFVRPIGVPQPLVIGGHPNHNARLKGYLCEDDEEQSDFKDRALQLIHEVDLKDKRQEVPPGQGIDKKKATTNENT